MPSTPTISASNFPSVANTRASNNPPPTVPAIRAARINGSLETCAAPRPTLTSNAASTAVVAAFARKAASSMTAQAMMISAGSFNRLFA